MGLLLEDLENGKVEILKEESKESWVMVVADMSIAFFVWFSPAMFLVNMFFAFCGIMWWFGYLD